MELVRGVRVCLAVAPLVAGLVAFSSGSAAGGDDPPRSAPARAPRGVRQGPADLPRRPSVLVILGDDFNGDDLQRISAPNIAAFAARGLSFTNGYVFPQCSTTRYSLCFGRYPRRDGIGSLIGMDPPGRDSPRPSLGLISLPRACQPLFLRSALIGKWHLGAVPFYDGDPSPDLGPADIGALTPLIFGFGEFLAGTMSNLSSDGVGYYDWKRVDNGVYSHALEYAPQAQLEAFEAWWQRGAQRLALFSPNLTHAPLQTPPPDWLPAGYPAPRSSRERFEAMLVAFDELVGRVLAHVDLATTYVFLLADNGTQPSIAATPCSPFATFEGCTKTTVWQGGIHVPFFVAGPGIAAGGSTDALVSSVDLMATVAELLGVGSPGEDSISFAPVLFDPARRTRKVAFSETFGYFQDQFGQPYYRAESAAIGARYKLRRLNGDELLFDLASDPREFSPLDPSAPGLQVIAAELRAVLDDPLDRLLQEF